MIQLSGEQVIEYGIPLVRECMGDLLGEKAAEQFEGATGMDTFWGVFVEDALVCLVGLGSLLSSNKVWLGWFCVSAKYRNKGLGGSALTYAEERAWEIGYKEIFIETYNSPIFEPAIKFYRGRGYKEVGGCAEYLDDGTDAVFMRKVL